MSTFTDLEKDAASVDGFVNENGLIPTRRNGPKPSYQYLVDGWNAQINAELDRTAGVGRDNAYETTSAGLAATVDGDYFSVVSSDDERYLDSYKNDGGTALFQKSYPSTEAVDLLTGRVDTIESSNDALEREPLGINANSDFSNTLNGTKGDEVGVPSLQSVGVEFTVNSGLAIAEAGVARGNAAILLHDAKFEKAEQSLTINVNGANSARYRDCGILIQYHSQTSYMFVKFNHTTGTVDFIRVDGATHALVLSQASDALLGIDEYTINVKHNNFENFTVSITVRGVESSALTYEYLKTAQVNFDRPHLPSCGIAFSADIVGVVSYTVNTDVTLVVNAISELEKGNDFDQPTTVDVKANEVTFEDGLPYNLQADKSQSLLIDDFTGAGVANFPAGYTKKYNSDSYPTGDYEIQGTSAWRVEADGLTPKSLGSSAKSFNDNNSIITTNLPGGWYERMRGVELRIKAFMPDDNQNLVAVLRYGKGEQPTDGSGSIVIQLNKTSLQIYTHNDNPSDSSDVVYFKEVFTADGSIGENKTFGRDIDIIIRAYNSNGRGDRHDFLYVEADGVRAAKFFSEPTDTDVRRSTLENITGVGFGVQSTDINSYSVKIKELRINPVPVAGSCLYRQSEPLPAPIVPEFTKVGLVFDADNADPAAKDTEGEILGPSIIPMLDYADKLGVTLIDNYYMYYSSDHVVGDGGIWLATAPTPEGPWALYGGALTDNRIYEDTDTGSQTEQPQVVYDEDNNRLIMIYHKRDVIPGTTQQSIGAISTDGVNFTRYGVVTDTSTEMRRRYANHDGYSSFCAKDPLGVVEGWIGWFRISGGAGAEGGQSSLWGNSRSKDGLSWVTDLLPIMPPSLQRPLHEQNIIANMGYGSVPFAYEGQRLFPMAPIKASAVGGGDGYLAIVRMGDDLRSLSASEYIIDKTLTTENGQIQVSSVFTRGNTLYLYYTAERRYVHLITADLSAPPIGVSRPF